MGAEANCEWVRGKLDKFETVKKAYENDYLIEEI